jgi:hypothetical protein
VTFHGETLEDVGLVYERGGDVAGARDALRDALVAYETKGSVAQARRVRAAIARLG